jgi:hypothetical protein
MKQFIERSMGARSSRDQKVNLPLLVLPFVAGFLAIFILLVK